MDDQPDHDVDERYPHRARDAELVAGALAGEDLAFGQLYDHWFDRVYATALRIVGQPEVAAEVAQDAFLSAWRNLATLEDAGAFGGWLLRIARNGGLNRHEREQRSRPVDDVGISMIEASGSSPSNAPAGFGADAVRAGAGAYDPASVAERNEMQELVWSAVAALPERDVEVLDLQLRYGMTPAEIGDIIGVNRNAANQLVHRVRGRFETAVRAKVLWRGDRPECPDLAALLTAAGIDAFGAEAVKVAERHAATCAACDEKRELRLRPAALFASVPLATAPIVLKQQVAGAMEAAGVPMQGSSFATSGAAASAAPTASGGTTSSDQGHGGASSGSGDDGSSTGDGTPRRGRRRHVLAMAAVVAVVLAAAIVLFAVETHDPPVPEVAESAETSPPPSSSASGAPTTTLADAGSSTTTEPVTTTTPTTAGSSSTTVVPTRVSVSLRLSSGSVTVGSTRSFAPPTLAWSVTGTGTFTVRLQGPTDDTAGTVPSTSAVGSGLVCPGTLDRGQCYFKAAHPTTVDYVVTVIGADGSVLTNRTVTLSIT